MAPHLTSRRVAACSLAIVLCLAAALPARAARYAWGHPRPQGNTVYGMAFATATDGWAVGGSGFVVRTTDGGLSWILQQAPLVVAPNLYDVIITPGGSLLACGDGAGIYRSDNQGASWQAVPHPATGELRDLALVPGGGLSAAGVGGAVLLSGDDGHTWSAAGPNVGTIRHHVWLTPLEGYAVGAGVSHRTVDGGAHWTQVVPTASFGYNEVFFTDPAHGCIVEDFAFRVTADGGATWTQVPQLNGPLYRYRTAALTADHWLTVCNGEGGELWETTDAGAHWSLHLSLSNIGFACLEQAPGGRVLYGADTGDLWYTDDFGLHNTNAAVNHAQEALGASINFLVARPDGRLFAQNQPSLAAETSSWLRSDDQGATWIEPATKPGLRWLTSGAFFDDQRGVVGSYADLRVTADGGATWQAASLTANHRLTDVALPALDRWFACTNMTTGGAVFRSTDQGAAWTPVAGGLPATGVNFNALKFTSPATGYAAGATTGGVPRLYRTLDGGATWQAVAVTGLATPITAWSWLDAQTVVAAARWSGVSSLSRSVDAGQTWTTVSTGTFSHVVFRDTGEGLATALGPGDPLHTDDYGLTWQALGPPLSGAFPGLRGAISTAAPTATGFVLGCDRNRILQLLPDAPAPVTDTPPRARPLLTVSPNPFNPATTLAFHIEAAGEARLTIHDLRGRSVRVLMHRMLPAGDHTVRWDGKDDAGRPVAAGVYLARLVADSQVSAAKLVLVK